MALGLLAACGSRHDTTDHYTRSVDVQRECCEHLDGPARAACLERIVTFPDEQKDVATSPTNQETFACVQRHFACDRSTGDATVPSKQAQLDCINDLDRDQP